MNLCLPSEILKKIRTSKECALACVEFLIAQQSPDELLVGTSLHLNGRGLNKTDAQFLHDKDVTTLRRKELVRVAAKYTEVQLLEAVREKKIRLTDFRDNHSCDSEAEDSDDDDVCLDDEDYDATTPGISNYGMHMGLFFTPSVHFCKRCLQIADRTRQKGVIVPKAVLEVINQENEWATLSHFSQNDIDLALYYAQSFDIRKLQNGMSIRLFWTEDWVNAKVQRIIKSPKLAVDLLFLQDATESRICNDRLLFLYALSDDCASVPRKKRALVVIDDDSDEEDTKPPCHSN